VQSSPESAEVSAVTAPGQQTVTADADSGVNLYILAGHEAMQL